MAPGDVRHYLQSLATAALAAPPAPTVSAAHLARIRQGATALDDALNSADEVEWAPRAVPASRDFTAATTDLGSTLLALSPTLPWQPARQDPVGQDRALLSINDLFDLGPIVAGFVLVRGNAHYPVHQHPPQELYLTIEGTASWRFGGSDRWQSVTPGHVFYNPPAARHGQQNDAEMNVSLYILWPDETGTT